MNLIFHIGLHKTATSWFQKYYFKNHPQIQLLNEHFNSPWNEELISYLVLNDSNSFSPQKYNSIVKERINSLNNKTVNDINIISAERLSGHPFSGGFDREIIALNISKTFPNTKILIFIRNQVEIIESVYKQLVNEGYIGTIYDLLKKQGWKLPLFNLNYFNYNLLTKMYIDIFNQHNIKIVLYEEFKDNPNSLFKSINDFFGVEYFTMPTTDIINKSQSIRSLKAKRLINQFRNTEFNNYPIIKINNQLIHKILIKSCSTFVSSSESFLTDKDRCFIKDYYKSSNKALFNRMKLNMKYSPIYNDA